MAVVEAKFSVQLRPKLNNKARQAVGPEGGTSMCGKPWTNLILLSEDEEQWG